MSEDSFEILWSSRFEEIADAYIPGTLDFLEKHRPKLYEKISLIEGDVNRAWKENRMVAFKIDTENWRKLMKQGIEQFERERMHAPKGEKLAPQAAKSKAKSPEPEAPRRKNFLEIFEEMKAKESF